MHKIDHVHILEAATKLAAAVEGSGNQDFTFRDMHGARARWAVAAAIELWRETCRKLPPKDEEDES